MSVLLLIEYSLEVASGKGFCKDLDKDYYRIGRSAGCWEAAKVCGVEKKPKVLQWFLCFSSKKTGNQHSAQMGQKLRARPVPWSPSADLPSPECFCRTLLSGSSSQAKTDFSDRSHTKPFYAF